MPDLSLSAKLPGGDKDGLSSLAAQLVEAPKTVRVAIVLLDVDRITTDPYSGERVPRVRIRAIEPITPNDDADEMTRLLRRSAERRTGQTELPLELERELEKLTPAHDTTEEDPS